MFNRKHRGPWPPSPKEPAVTLFKAVISSTHEVVPGGILRAGKTDYGSGTGFWLGIDPTDDEAKFDIGTPTDYFRYSETDGVLIAADGSALTNIDGGEIQTGTLTANAIHALTITAAELAANSVTAAKINVTNLQAVSAQTGALTVDDTLTMGEDGIITWMSGAAKITDDYMDVALTTSNRYAFRFLDGQAVHAYLGAYKSANLTQLNIEIIGPAQGKYGKFAISAIEFIGEDPETVDFTVRSDTGVLFSALNYASTRLLKIDTMDAHFTNRVGIATAPHATIHLDIAGLARHQGLYLSHTLPQIRWYDTDAADDSSDFIRQTYTANNFVSAWYDASASTYYTRLVLEGDTGLVDIYGDTIRLRTPKTPGSAGAAGTTGDKCWDTNYEYRCVNTNTWKRQPIATW